MKKFFLLTTMIFAFLMMSVVCFAQTLPSDATGSVDWMTLIGQLIANPKAASAAFVGALIVLIVIQAMKSETFGKFFKFIPDQAQLLVITVLGQLYAIALHAFVLKDQQISVALVGIFSSGGAAAIFNGLKLAFPKVFGKQVEAKV